MPCSNRCGLRRRNRPHSREIPVRPAVRYVWPVHPRLSICSVFYSCISKISNSVVSACKTFVNPGAMILPGFVYRRSSSLPRLFCKAHVSSFIPSEVNIMALIDRLARLFQADLHAVLDRIEEPEVLLRQ